MMKFYVLAIVLAAAHAKTFTVTEKNDTCLILQLDGKVDLTANETVSLNFDDATQIESSNCTLIKLNLTKSVEVWFQFNDVSGQWEVTPIAQFVPDVVFGKGLNSSVVYTANKLEKDFKKNESYQCIAATQLPFKQTPSSQELLNITVTASTTNFKIQSLNSSGFVTGEKCQKDTPSTPAHTTPAHTTPVPTKPTPQPSVKQNFSCVVNNTTKFRVVGIFSLAITYNTTDGKTKTVSVDVPQAERDKATDCSSSFNETLIFSFFDGWRIEYIFKMEAPNSPKYYVSDVTVTYVYDSHLPNSSTNGSATVHNSQSKYLESSTNGYYICKSNISLALAPHVTLHTKNFQYKAFNDKGEINFSSGDVNECKEDQSTSSVVPIAVGAALAGLVVIVLIAYLIGRRRSRKAGYESV